jgi:hypothetical protein
MLVYKMMICIVDGLLPWSIFDKKSWEEDGLMSLHKLLSEYRPDAKIVSHQTLKARRTVEYQAMKKALILHLPKFPFLYGRSDAWSTDADINMRMMIVSGVDPETWKLHSYVLVTRACHRHTSTQIAEFYKSVCDEYGIKKVQGIVGDGAEKCGVEKFECSFCHCAAHRINLILTHATEAQVFKDTVTLVKGVVSIFKRHFF